MATTRAQLVTKVRRKADAEYADGDGKFTDAAIIDAINDSYAELYDLLVQKHEDYFTKRATITQASGELPLPADGVMRIRRLAWNSGDPEPTYLKHVTLEEFDRYTSTTDDPIGYMFLGQKLYPVPVPADGTTYTMYYVPDFTALAADGDTLPGGIVAKWEEYIVLDAAIKLLQTEETDTTSLKMDKAALQMRIMRAATDRGGNHRVVEVMRYDWDEDELWRC